MSSKDFALGFITWSEMVMKRGRLWENVAVRANASFTNLVIYTIQKLFGAFYFYIAVSFFFYITMRFAVYSEIPG